MLLIAITRGTIPFIVSMKPIASSTLKGIMSNAASGLNALNVRSKFMRSLRSPWMIFARSVRLSVCSPRWKIITSCPQSQSKETTLGPINFVPPIIRTRILHPSMGSRALRMGFPASFFLSSTKTGLACNGSRICELAAGRLGRGPSGPEPQVLLLNAVRELSPSFSDRNQRRDPPARAS